MRKIITQKGFTLIEMMVAVALFVVVALITTGALIAMSNASRQIQNSAFLMENVGLALDSISYKAQQIKDGTYYICLSGLPSSYSTTPPAQDCNTSNSTGGDTLVFTYVDSANPNSFTTYAYSRRQDMGTGQYYIAYKKDPGGNLSSMDRLTAPGVNITQLQFFVDNTASAGKGQVTVLIQAEVLGKNNTKVSFTLQRTVTRQTQ